MQVPSLAGWRGERSGVLLTSTPALSCPLLRFPHPHYPHPFFWNRSFQSEDYEINLGHKD